jgi:predicted permease
MRDLRFWRGRRTPDDDLDRELDLHLDLAAEEHGDAGPRDARLAARRQFGSVSLTREDVRALRPGAALRRLLTFAARDFWYGLRLLRRTPGFTTVAVLILALPIAVNSVVFSLVHAVLFQPRPGRIDTLVSVFNRDRQRPDSYRSFSYPLYADLRDRSAIFESLMAHTLALVGVRDGETTRRGFAEIVSSNYFSTLGVRLAAGRPFTIEEERPAADLPVAIASYGLWRRRGFDPGFIGSQVRVNSMPFTIVGIAPEGLRTTPLMAPDWYFPLGVHDRLMNEWFRQGPRRLDDRGNHTLFLAGALAPGVTRAAAEDALDGMAVHLAEDFPGTDRDRTFSLGDVSRLDLSAEPIDEAPAAFMAGLLMLMAALVLGIACLNLTNLMLSRGAARRREIGIRQALGGGRARIVGQLLMEGLSLSMVGVVAGLLCSWWAHAALTAWLATVAGSSRPMVWPSRSIPRRGRYSWRSVSASSARSASRSFRRGGCRSHR